MRKNITNLINSGLTAYTVSKETGLTRNPIERLFRGEVPIDNITFKTAETLNNYYNKNKGAIEMRKEMKDLREWEVIEKANEILEEDVTENFNEAQERSSIDGTDFFT